ncbi:MAG: phage holin family protein [Kofleriaceae bacterium]
MAGLLGDVKQLAAGHIGRTKEEMSHEMTELKLTLMRVTIAVGVGSVSAMLLGHAIVAGLVAVGLVTWASYLLVALAGIGISVFLLLRWKPSRQKIDLIPDDSFDQLKHDVAEIGEHVSKS